jgi:poly-beta-1,6-N-acetyl-D-glucosamine synthase
MRFETADMVPPIERNRMRVNPQASSSGSNHAYVLVTAAHNEEAYIEGLIQSIVRQTLKPKQWVIVSDASTDRTDEIVQRYAAEHPFIRLHRNDGGHRHNFAAKDFALQAGYDCLKETPFDFIGILDADISLEPDYFASLLRAFDDDPSLGLTGGFIYEKSGGEFTSRGGNRTWSVAGATQIFRRECYEGIGGYTPLKYGGSDWCAEVSARMKGWTVRAIPELKVFHHRPTGTARNLPRYLFHLGRMDYSIGCHPLFEVVKCLGRLGGRPFVLGAFARLAGFFWSYLIRANRTVSAEFISFLRKEQRQRLLPAFITHRSA